MTHFPRQYRLPLGAYIRLPVIDSQYLLFLFSSCFLAGPGLLSSGHCVHREPTGKAVMSSTVSVLSAPNYPIEAGRGDGQEDEDTRGRVMLVEPLNHLTLTSENSPLSSGELGTNAATQQ